ncbi:MAG TPA: hypothetical protein VEA36_00385 [Candidatus Paceibacterota bacterium]|nr:hypothetical protein [Candidatus Paceibacterota bacterium]
MGFYPPTPAAEARAHIWRYKNWIRLAEGYQTVCPIEWLLKGLWLFWLRSQLVDAEEREERYR